MTYARITRILAVSFLVVFLAMLMVGAFGVLAVDAPVAEAQESAEGVVPAVDDALEATAADAGIDIRQESQDTPFYTRLVSFLGIFGLLGIALAMSNNRRRVDWRLVGMGVSLQLLFAILILKTPVGRPIFDAATGVFNRLLEFTDAGSEMLFWGQESLVNTFVFGILPTIVFFSSLMTVMYYLGIMQRIVKVVAWAMRKTMRTSGSETLSAAANIFVGQTEAPLMIKPYIAGMTKSELMAVMTGGFATVAGGVMAAYIGFLSRFFPDIAGHLLAASVMSAPAALVIAKIMYPETEDSPTRGRVIEVETDAQAGDANVIDAAARGASEGLTLALNVAAMLLAFVALIALVNFMFAYPSYLQHGWALSGLIKEVMDAGMTVPPEVFEVCAARMSEVPAALADVEVPAEIRQACADAIVFHVYGGEGPSVTMWHVLTLESIFGVLFWPIALLMGTPIEDCYAVGQLLGTKMVVNEFVAYDNLNRLLRDPETTLHPRSVIISTYALCGFANFGSIAIQIGGIGGIAPERRGDLARLGLRAMIGGSLAAFMTATIAGILI